MSSLTLFEHETEPEDDVVWSDRDLRLVERLNRTVQKPVVTPVYVDKRIRLRAGSQVGVLRLGRCTVQVLPKLYRRAASLEDRSAYAREATANLLALLAGAYGMEVTEQECTDLARRRGDWFELLTRLFCRALLPAWQQGAPHAYVEREDEQPRLVGRWLLAEQARRPDRLHAFKVRRTEFTADTPLNRVLRFVVERLRRLTVDATNRRDLELLTAWMDGVTLPARVSAADADPARLSRLHRRYTPILTLARFFLGSEVTQLAAGDDKSFAFTFDMNSLFEAYLVSTVQRRRSSILPPALASCTLLPQTKGAVRYLAHNERGDELFRMKPDLALCDADGSFPLLVDAKYKVLDPQDRRLHVKQDDLYQMAAYAAVYECPRVLLLYPQTADMDAAICGEFTLEGTGARVSVHTVDLRRDLYERSERDLLAAELRDIFHALASGSAVWP